MRGREGRREDCTEKGRIAQRKGGGEGGRVALIVLVNISYVYTCMPLLTSFLRMSKSFNAHSSAYCDSIRFYVQFRSSHGIVQRPPYFYNSVFAYQSLCLSNNYVQSRILKQVFQPLSITSFVSSFPALTISRPNTQPFRTAATHSEPPLIPLSLFSLPFTPCAAPRRTWRLPLQGPHVPS
jgi:hypothetical protein